MSNRDRDWCDTEDHDFLNEFVGQRVDRIETGTTDGLPWVTLHTNRGRALTVKGETGVCWPVLTIEEP